MPGPLAGLKVVEFAGIGPAPFCAMVLADLGADVLRIVRPTPVSERSHPSTLNKPDDPAEITARSRPTIALDLRSDAGATTALDFISHADALIEGFRPGVMERLGLGPQACLARNPKLVYGRMTGWGQTGPLASTAGHDIDYIAVAGALHAIGIPGQPPVPPVNFIGDFGGGAMLLAVGLLAALWEAKSQGLGQVVDAAMTDGTALLSAFLLGLRARGQWPHGRGENVLDGGAPYYATYECADGRFLAVGALEPQFWAEFRRRAGIADDADFDEQHDHELWPAQKAKLAALMRTRTRDEWCTMMAGSDACVAPVLSWDEAREHPHNAERGTYVEVAGVVQPAPAPRFSRSALAAPSLPRVLSLDEARTAWCIDSIAKAAMGDKS